MRQISAQLLDPESLIELKSGHRLELVQGGKTIAEIVPVVIEASVSEAEREAAMNRLRQWMDKGLDLGVVWNGRDELYDRD
jgi:hypothetical protein